MTFQPNTRSIDWKLHFQSPPEQVFLALSTDSGRSNFWAESTHENNGCITFHILNYQPYTGKIITSAAPEQFTLEYFGTIADFRLQSDSSGGTELSLHATEVPESQRTEMIAGWVSVLMAMKAYVDHGVDLRNHNENRVWSNGYADN